MNIYKYTICTIFVLLAGSIGVRDTRAVSIGVTTPPLSSTTLEASRTSTTPVVTKASTASPAATTSEADPFFLSQINNYLTLGTNSPIDIVTSLIRIGLSFLTIIFLLMILWSGTQFLFSFGNDERMKQARQTFFQAIVGIIIIFMALSIVTFLFDALGTATGAGNELTI